MTKRCSKCKEVKPKSQFNKNIKSKDGCQSNCNVCRKEARDDINTKQAMSDRKKLYYDENKVAILLTQKADRENNPERYKKIEARKYLKSRDKILSRVSEYQKAKPEVGRKAGKKYRTANPDKQCAKAAKRRARLLKATPEWALDDEWEQFLLAEVYHLASLRTSLLGTEFHVDHVVPLVSELVCGRHISCNLAVLHGRENSSKGNRYWPDMWLDSDFKVLDNVVSQTH